MTEQAAEPRQPAVRIVHHGGPGRRAAVYVNGREAKTATRVEIVLDASQRPGVHARIEFVGGPPIETTHAQLDIAAEDAELVEARPETPRYYWPALLGLLLNAIPAGLAWWMWGMSGWLPMLVFVLCVSGGIVWTLGTIGALVGYGRVMAAAERRWGQDDAEPESEREQC